MMETRADHEPSDDPSPPPAAPAYLPWIMLENFGSCDDPDARTVARGRTSKGHPFSVGLVLAAPPAVSRLRVDSPGLPDGVWIISHAMAAHGDSVLAKIETRCDPRKTGNSGDDHADDYFLYCAGDARTSLPPSLTPLPPCYLTEQDQQLHRRTWDRAPAPKKKRYMDGHAIALLRRGQDEVVVAALDFRGTKNRDAVLEAELCLLRSGDWELKKLPIIHDEGKREEVSRWQTDRVVPVGDRFLLWVDYFRGIVYSDPWQETPELRYLSLPVEQDPWRSQDRWGTSYRTVCATDNGGRSVRFAEIFPRCCCGSPGAQPWFHRGIACAVSRYAFTITTWALGMDDMTTWNKIRVVDCHELWSLPGYHGVVPRIRPEYPTVSLDDPDVLCFVVNKTTYDQGVDGELGTWLIEFNTRRIELCSIRYYPDKQFFFGPNFIGSPISQYFDTSSRDRDRERGKHTDLEAPARPSKLTFPRVASPEEMMATLREIPDLAHDDMMKVYGVLASDDSQYMFRSLLALPMDMRKDYCLLIGKFSCFDV